jgi:hypothetical protein
MRGCRTAEREATLEMTDDVPEVFSWVKSRPCHAQDTRHRRAAGAPVSLTIFKKRASPANRNRIAPAIESLSFDIEHPTFRQSDPPIRGGPPGGRSQAPFERDPLSFDNALAALISPTSPNT